MTIPVMKALSFLAILLLTIPHLVLCDPPPMFQCVDWVTWKLPALRPVDCSRATYGIMQTAEALRGRRFEFVRDRSRSSGRFPIQKTPYKLNGGSEWSFLQLGQLQCLGRTLEVALISCFPDLSDSIFPGTCKLVIMPFRDAEFVPGGPDVQDMRPFDDDTGINLAHLANELYVRCARQGNPGWITAGESL